MFAMAALMLAGGAKGFFEDPAYLIGIPLLALGAIGMLIVLSRIGIARPPQAGTEVTPEADGEASAVRTEEQGES
jgi:hypothetical protein